MANEKDELPPFTQTCCCGCGDTPPPHCLRAVIERLKAACTRMMIGGNHIATYRTDKWPDYGTEPMVALEKLGAGREYDMWCCWNAIMCARDEGGLR